MRVISVLTGLTGVFLARFSFLFYSKCNVRFNQKQAPKVSECYISVPISSGTEAEL